jgi:flagellar biosynthesis protein FliR
MEIYVSQFIIYLLLFVRITSLVVVAPILGHQVVPVQFKVALGLFLALVFYPVASQSPLPDTRLLPLVVVALKEAAVGLTIGFVMSLLLAGAQFAGDIIGFSMGLSMASIFDPESNQNIAIVGQFLYLCLGLLFLLLNGHHFVLEALHLSYQVVPVGTFTMNAALGEGIVRLTGMVFVVAIKLAAPIIVALFLIDVGLAVLARVVPQMNIFMVSFPLKIAVGMIMMMATGPMIVYVFKKLLTSFETDVLEIVKVL